MMLRSTFLRVVLAAPLALLGWRREPKRVVSGFAPAARDLLGQNECLDTADVWPIGGRRNGKSLVGMEAFLDAIEPDSLAHLNGNHLESWNA